MDCKQDPPLTVTQEQVIEALKLVEDPELFLDLWFLGLIYGIEIDPDQAVRILMTFTSPMCPVGPSLVEQVKARIGEVPGVARVDVDVVFTPPWKPSDEVKAMLGMI